MKKIFLLLFTFLTLQIFASYQYNSKGNQTWITFDSSTNLYLNVSRSGKTNNHENFIDKGNGVVDWGWYNLNTKESGSFKENGEFIFTENDKIAVWVKDEQGNTYSSVKNTSNYIWGKSDLKDGVFKVYGGNKGSNGSHEYYIFTVTTVPTNNDKPTGQPLPGIIATLIVGGLGIGYLKNRKRLLK
jgi:hypothetical protein